MAKNHKIDMVTYVTQLQVLAAKQREVEAKSEALGYELEKCLADAFDATYDLPAATTGIIMREVQREEGVLDKLMLLSLIAHSQRVNDVPISASCLRAINSVLSEWN